MKKSYSLRQTVHVTVCRKLSRLLGVFSVSEEFLPQSTTEDLSLPLPLHSPITGSRTTSSSIVSDDDLHKLPASRDERADGGHGSESLH